MKNLDVVLSLTDKNGKSTNGRLVIHVAARTTSAVRAALHLARVAGEKLDQNNLTSSFDSLLAKVNVLITMGNAISKVFPFCALSTVLIFVIDASLREPCLAITVRGVTGGSIFYLSNVSRSTVTSIVSERTTNSRQQDFKSYHDHGRYLFFCNISQRSGEGLSPSSHCRTNFETNDRMWLFHPGVCTT